MNKEILLKRLSIVKLLYKQGLEQSKQSEATSFFSILSFHDCIDMYLNIAAEYSNLSVVNQTGKGCWETIGYKTL